MKPDIEKIVDFEKLKRCNDLCFKWSKYFKIKKSHLGRFAIKLSLNPQAFAEKVSKRYKSKFIADCKFMFYASEVENILVEQYSAMVFNIMRRLKIPHHRYEEYVTDGYLAIRSSVWQYRNYKVKASFTTYVHKSIFMRLRGILHKQKLKRLLERVTFEADMSEKKFNYEMMHLQKDCNDNMENINEQILELSQKCSLTQQETMLLMSFANRRSDVPLWYADYQKKYINKKLNKQYSRQSIHNHLATIHEKVFSFLKNSNDLPLGYVRPTTKRGDLK